LVNLSNSMKKTESKNSFNRNTINTNNTNKFFIGKNKNEVLYSDLMLKREQSPLSSTITNINNFANTQKKPSYNNNLIKK
jgi:hypothetical protein